MAFVETNSADVLLLNEAPFDVWFAREPEFDADQWHDAVENHHRAMATLDGLGCAVIATAPVTLDSGRHNRAFTSEPDKGVSWWRRKAYLPNEEPVYEASWYSAAYDPPDVRTVAGARVGVLTCTEIWRMEWASQLGQLGAQVIATPRATGDDSLDKWLAAGRVAAVTSGAFSLSSNRSGGGFGGGGWIFAPDGELLATTTHEAPFAICTIDLALADAAKATYPRDALWDSPW